MNTANMHTESRGAKEKAVEVASKPRRREGIEAHSVLDELVLYVPGQELGVSLNPSARAVWELCDGQRTLAEISQELGQDVGCPGDDLLADVEAAVRQLSELGLVEMV
jgi:hypothetical protein